MERYVIRGGREGYERLLLLAEMRRADTLKLLRRAGVSPGMRCLDLGCGGGAVTFEFAAQVGPAGSVLGIDMDEVKLELARQAAAERGLANVEFRAANVNDWDEPDAYDIVYCRFLLQHLSRPADVLRRMWRAVRPGGCLVAEDADFDGAFCEPQNDGFDFYVRMYKRVLQHSGGDPATPRKLYRYFLEAGTPDPELYLAQAAYATGAAKTIALSTLQAIAEAIVGAGLASPAEVTAAIKELAAFTAADVTLVGDPRIFQLCARR